MHCNLVKNEFAPYYICLRIDVVVQHQHKPDIRKQRSRIFRGGV